MGIGVVPIGIVFRTLFLSTSLKFSLSMDTYVVNRFRYLIPLTMLPWRCFDLFLIGWLVSWSSKLCYFVNMKDIILDILMTNEYYYLILWSYDVSYIERKILVKSFYFKEDGLFCSEKNFFHFQSSLGIKVQPLFTKSFLGSWCGGGGGGS